MLRGGFTKKYTTVWQRGGSTKIYELLQGGHRKFRILTNFDPSPPPILNEHSLIYRSCDMGFSGRPPGLPTSENRSPKPKPDCLGRPGDRSFQHCPSAPYRSVYRHRSVTYLSWKFMEHSCEACIQVNRSNISVSTGQIWPEYMNNLGTEDLIWWALLTGNLFLFLIFPTRTWVFGTASKVKRIPVGIDKLRLNFTRLLSTILVSSIFPIFPLIVPIFPILPTFPIFPLTFPIFPLNYRICRKF